ncbi:N-terminal domain of galactosyltransferase [bacterium A37T11]|nr:N-terminal domain of galactosyltransferase [bacterium A37T11]
MASLTGSDCSLIISTYNWPEALELTLMSVMLQSVIPGEVIIADDGSEDRTKALIGLFKSRMNTKVIHVWQEDKGFRLAAVRNKSFVRASNPYIIQIDGDIILHPRFVEDHLRFAKKGRLLQGSRVMLGKQRSERLLHQKEVMISVFQSDIKRRENAIRIPALANYLLRRYRNRYPIYFARGANMSFWKADLLLVNGYDEQFKGWGHEDSDLTLRLLNAGVEKCVLKFCAVAYHLFHAVHSSKEADAHNKALLAATLQQQTIQARFGLDQYPESNE